MTTSTTVHCNMVENAKFTLSDTLQVKHHDGQLSSFRTLKIGDYVDILITDKQAEELCETIEKKIYDDPSYKELNKICMDQKMRIEELEERLSIAKEEACSEREHMSFQDVI